MGKSKATKPSKPVTTETTMPAETNTPPTPPAESASQAPAPAKQAAAPRLRLDDSGMQSSYANYANVTSTREETVLLLGMIQAFDRTQNEIPVRLTDRVVMTPFVARRLARMLNNLITNYEAQFGPLGEEK